MINLTIEFLSWFWMFGALLCWPVMRFLVRYSPQELQELKWQFWLQIAGLTITYGLVLYFKQTPSHDWLHSLLLPHVVGILGWITALVILFNISMRRGKGE